MLRLGAGTLGNAEISERLSLSIRTAQVHLMQVFAKLDVRSRTQAVIAVLKGGLLKLEDLGEG